VSERDQLKNKVINDLLREMYLDAEECMFMGLKKQARVLEKVCARLKDMKVKTA